MAPTYLTLDDIRSIHVRFAEGGILVTRAACEQAAEAIEPSDPQLAEFLRAQATDMDRPVTVDDVIASIEAHYSGDPDGNDLE
jgi:hypothetical protein